MRIALGQLNLTVGDLEGNVDRMSDATAAATAAGADLICFPELAITGYPPEDLVLRAEFVRDNLEALGDLARQTATRCAVVAGFVDRSDAGIHNAAAYLQRGDVQSVYHKLHLPNFGVFDEQRYFVPGTEGVAVERDGQRVGLSICEDAWHDAPPFTSYAGMQFIVNINGSPFHRGKISEREDVLRARTRRTGAWIVYVNAVGGQDELVFDGGSMVMAPDGSVTHRAKMFDEDLLIVNISEGVASMAEPARDPWPVGPEETYRALVVGLRDYVGKNGFTDVVVGMSGGIDSSLVATWRPTRWAHRRCTRSPCLRSIPPPRAWRTPRSARARWASASTRSPSPRCSTATDSRWPNCSRARRRTWRRRTCSRACAATC